MIKSITVHELYFVYQKKDVMILDIRKTNEYIKKHLSHSISIPVTSLSAQLNNLDVKKHYYIVGASNDTAQQIAAYLSKNGFQATYVIDNMKLFENRELTSSF
ncbi:rhodanese-like domain-containing protein [Enterococcus sp. DIV1298c]|uniref:rhodanese-like domain-containing protein n=1 Tax=Enterococcus sp. DIV1298c TaxID=2815328 RepID=UPI001A91E634|nr:rhodanese-like domain-containing protein [Enterococcus sp. DIV1298c]MBO0461152.1 rhodanese-like domain-containing protein [Enterococcus sp. DIV1298c]